MKTQKKKTLFLKTILLFALSFSVTLSFAQTKEDTEKWILEKIKLHKNEEYNNYDNSNFSNSTITQFNAVIQDALLIISWTENYRHRWSSRGRWEDVQEDYIYQIPIYEIRSATLEKHRYSNHLVIYADCVFDNRCYKKTGNFESNNGYFPIPFRYAPEENFIERFNKAIKHLKTFYPAPPKPEKKKETF